MRGPMPVRIKGGARSAFPTPIHQDAPSSEYDSPSGITRSLFYPRDMYLLRPLERCPTTCSMKLQSPQQGSVFLITLVILGRLLRSNCKVWDLSPTSVIWGVDVGFIKALGSPNPLVGFWDKLFQSPVSPLRAWRYTHSLLLLQDGEGNKLVLNPITKAIKEIPRAPFDDDVLGHGLGYDSASDDYKIIVVSLYDTDLLSKSDKIFVYICSLKNGTWKKAASCPNNNRAIFCPSRMFVHGCIHWIAWSATVCNYAVVAFDLMEEKLCNVPLPPSVDSRLLPFFTVAELGGCLCISKAADIWLMKEYGVLESWTKFTVPNVGVRPWFLCSLGEEQGVMKRDGGFGPLYPVVLYNLKHGTLKDVVIDDDSILLSIEMSFVESPVSPPRQQ